MCLLTDNYRTTNLFLLSRIEGQLTTARVSIEDNIALTGNKHMIPSLLPTAGSLDFSEFDRTCVRYLICEAVLLFGRTQYP